MRMATRTNMIYDVVLQAEPLRSLLLVLLVYTVKVVGPAAWVTTVEGAATTVELYGAGVVVVVVVEVVVVVVVVDVVHSERPRCHGSCSDLCT